MSEAPKVCVKVFLTRVLSSKLIKHCDQKKKKKKERKEKSKQWQLIYFLTRNVMPACVLSLQLCLTLCNPMECSPPGSVHGILQERVLERVAMPSSRGSFQPRDQTYVSYICLHWQADSLPRAPPEKPKLCTVMCKDKISFFNA